MQKIRCPRCGVVNLEKFITYPHCAGCGSTLPAPRESPLPFWQRPLGASLWVSVIGIAMIGIVIATSFLYSPPENEAQLVIYGNTSRRIQLQQTVIVNLTIDAVSQNSSQQRAPLQNVKVRLPRTLFKKFAFVSLEPKPDTITSTFGGRYFQYDFLPRETTLKLRLYARSVGQQRARAAVYADEHSPGSYAFSIFVMPPIQQ